MVRMCSILERGRVVVCVCVCVCVPVHLHRLPHAQRCHDHGIVDACMRGPCCVRCEVMPDALRGICETYGLKEAHAPHAPYRGYKGWCCSLEIGGLARNCLALCSCRWISSSAATRLTWMRRKRFTRRTFLHETYYERL
eukprot:4314938-Amphidinium_carterae.1